MPLGVPWLGSCPLGIALLGMALLGVAQGTLYVEVGGRVLIEVQQEVQGYRQEGRLGLVGPMEGEDLDLATSLGCLT